MTENTRIVPIGLIQATSSESVDDNLNRTMEMIRRAAASGAKIICTQELFKSPYFCQTEDQENFGYAEDISPGSPAVQPFQALAAELEIVIIASLFEKRAVGLYHNTTVVIDADGSYLGKYRKMHIPDDPLYYEKYYFTPGDLGFKSFKTRYAEIGVLICWDQWYPEAARLTAMRGAEVIFIPTAIGYGTSEESSGYDDSWETVQRGHAVANACFVAAVNRVGFEPEPNGKGGIQFWGKSFVSDPYGKLLAKASADQEEVIIAELDLDFIRRVREGFSFPFRDRRVDHYSGLTQLYGDTDEGVKR